MQATEEIVNITLHYLEGGQKTLKLVWVGNLEFVKRDSNDSLLFCVVEDQLGVISSYHVDTCCSISKEIHAFGVYPVILNISFGFTADNVVPGWVNILCTRKLKNYKVYLKVIEGKLHVRSNLLDRDDMFKLDNLFLELGKIEDLGLYFITFRSQPDPLRRFYPRLDGSTNPIRSSGILIRRRESIAEESSSMRCLPKESSPNETFVFRGDMVPTNLHRRKSSYPADYSVDSSNNNGSKMHRRVGSYRLTELDKKVPMKCPPLSPAVSTRFIKDIKSRNGETSKRTGRRLNPRTRRLPQSGNTLPSIPPSIHTVNEGTNGAEEIQKAIDSGPYQQPHNASLESYKFNIQKVDSQDMTQKQIDEFIGVSSGNSLRRLSRPPALVLDGGEYGDEDGDGAEYCEQDGDGAEYGVYKKKPKDCEPLIADEFVTNSSFIDTKYNKYSSQMLPSIVSPPSPSSPTRLGYSHDRCEDGEDGKGEVTGEGRVKGSFGEHLSPYVNHSYRTLSSLSSCDLYRRDNEGRDHQHSDLQHSGLQRTKPLSPARALYYSSVLLKDESPPTIFRRVEDPCSSNCEMLRRLSGISCLSESLDSPPAHSPARLSHSKKKGVYLSPSTPTRPLHHSSTSLRRPSEFVPPSNVKFLSTPLLPMPESRPEDPKRVDKQGDGDYEESVLNLKPSQSFSRYLQNSSLNTKYRNSTGNIPSQARSIEDLSNLSISGRSILHKDQSKRHSEPLPSLPSLLSLHPEVKEKTVKKEKKEKKESVTTKKRGRKVYNS